MWEVDQETKGKLLALQKRPANAVCCDCGNPSPQWSSPKFGAFICLTCAGLHRGLGVHISFVRSNTMDAFKPAEIARLDLGGNERWQKFWESRNPGKMWGQPGKGGDGAAAFELEKRYGGDEGEEWKERLACEVEGREFTGMPVKEKRAMDSRGRDGSTSRSGSPFTGAGGGSGTAGNLPRTQKQQNESFFARKGAENAHRPEGVAPSQGGKYSGFGSAPAEPPTGSSSGGAGAPGIDEFQKDPVAALSKGFGWFTGQVGKGAKSVNDGWIQPTAQKLAEADLASQARNTAFQASRGLQSGAKLAADRFNNFVEDTGGSNPTTTNSSNKKSAPQPERKDFWDSFGEPDKKANPAAGGSSSIGTAAMRKGGDGATGTAGKEDGWDNW